MNYPKIFLIGFNKCGTTSFHEYLRQIIFPQFTGEQTHWQWQLKTIKSQIKSFWMELIHGQHIQI